MKKIFEIIERYLEKKCGKKEHHSIIFHDSSKIEMDSRKVEKGDIFFAINSGNNFIEEVLKKEPALIFADQKNERIQDERVVLVEDSIKTMQELAHEYAEVTDTKIIGITGSNGKTTTKDIVYSILSQRYKVEKTKGNYNNHIGLPFTILTADENLDFLILEMGMSDLGEIDLLCDIARPDYGIITNIGLSHMETLKTQENVFRAKTEMMKYIASDNIFVSGDDKYLKKVPAVKVGYDELSDCILKNFQEKEEGIEFDLEIQDRVERYTSYLNGRYNSINLGIAIALAKKVGLDHDEIQQGIDMIKLTDMRFQKVQWRGFEVINDAYNASPLSMEAGLETFASVYGSSRKIAILGDMLELGEREIIYHKEVIEKALKLGIHELMLFGPRMYRALEELKNEKDKNINLADVKWFSSKEEIKSDLARLEGSSCVLFLKGSRGMGLEEILK